MSEVHLTPEQAANPAAALEALRQRAENPPAKPAKKISKRAKAEAAAERAERQREYDEGYAKELAEDRAYAAKQAEIEANPTVEWTVERIGAAESSASEENPPAANFPNLFGLSVTDFSERIEDFHVPESADADALRKAYQELCLYDSVAKTLGNSIGLLARKKGTILNRLYHVDKDKRATSIWGDNQKAWTEFRTANCKESEDTLENYRHIAERFPLSDRSADGLGVVDMLRTIADEKPPKNRKGKGDKKKFRIADLSVKLVNANSGLTTIAKNLLKATDLTVDVEKTLHAIDDALGYIKEIEGHIPKLKKVLAQARKKAEQFKSGRAKMVNGKGAKND